MNKLNKKTTALIVIDLQKGIISRPTQPHESYVVIENAKNLIDKFRENKMPVFLVHVSNQGPRLSPITDEQWKVPDNLPKDWSELVIKKEESDIIIEKKQWGAFYGTDLDLQLRRRGICTIVLLGIATNYGVESTARFAAEYGYNQVFVEDAMASMTKEMHDASVNFVLKRIGIVRKTDEVIDALK